VNPGSSTSGRPGHGPDPLALVIVGAGRHGLELEAYLQDLPQPVHFLGFLDEHRPPGPVGTGVVLGNFERVPELIERHGEVHYLTAVGDNHARERLAAQADAAGLRPWTLRHPAAHVGPDSEIGDGTLLAPGAIITRAVSVGSHCIVNVGVTISHDCIIGEFVNLNPGVTVCGDVEVGASCFVGAGSTVIDKVSIGAGTVVGAGAVVIDSLPAGVLALGVPARVVRELHTRPRLV
jgi:sugar O-acyltransferase (sialic acid O-acetyltransferase NeuD family)